MRFDRPQQYEFNDADREAYADRYWSCPTSLVRDGIWATLWRSSGSARGGGTATSILPLLALHTWPGREVDELQRHNAEMLGSDFGSARASVVGPYDEGIRWTPWAYISRRRIAAVCGISKDSVGTGLDLLRRERLVQTVTVSRGRYEGGQKVLYRLNANMLFPPSADAVAAGSETSPFAQISGNLLYGGAWAMLPTSASRHLYVVLACMDGVLDEEGWLSAGGDPDDDQRARACRLERRRRAFPISGADLERLSGLSHGTVVEALSILLAGLFDNHKLPLLRRGETGRGRTFWYAPHRAAARWHFHPEYLNDPSKLRTIQAAAWPMVMRQRAEQARRATKRGAKKGRTLRRAA